MTLTADLPFVRMPLGAPAQLWVVEPSGDWAVDNETGHGYADVLLAHIAATENHPLLGQVCREIGRRDTRSGIEAGFFQRISERAVG